MLLEHPPSVSAVDERCFEELHFGQPQLEEKENSHSLGQAVQCSQLHPWLVRTLGKSLMRPHQSGLRWPPGYNVVRNRNFAVDSKIGHTVVRLSLSHCQVFPSFALTIRQFHLHRRALLNRYHLLVL